MGVTGAYVDVLIVRTEADRHEAGFKNKLTSEQQAKLEEIRSRQGSK